jgi:PAS domain S-box-containing protein
MISQYNTVLIVEDDEALLRLIQKNLQRAGLHTEVAHNGAEAIARVSNKSPDLLLLDYRLPDMTGKQVIETLARQQLSVPFIVITGHGDEKVAVEIMKLGARDYLVKDASFLDLFLPVVTQVIEQLTLEKQLAHAEKSLRESEARISAIFEAADNISFIITNYAETDSNILEFSPGAERIFGYSREEVLDKPVAILHLPENMARLPKTVGDTKQKKSGFASESTLVRKSGEIFPALFTTYPILDMEGNLAAALVVIIDITDRKRIEKQYQAIFENSGDAIWVQDLDGNILTANEATARLLGFNREDLAGMNSNEFLSSEALVISREMQKRLLQGEAVDNPYELRLIKKNGAEVILRLTTNLLSSVSQPVGLQNIARDVTEEYRAQENLKFYAQQVIKAQEEERKRIARELHDDTAQRLIALSHQLEDFARSKNQLSVEDQKIIVKLREQAKEALQEVRYFTQDLRPPILDDLGLLPALEWLTDDLKEHCGIETDLVVLGNQRRLSPEAELLLFRILQEAVNNIKRHAQASRIKITVEFNNGKTKAIVSDNGIGFRVPKTLSDLSRAGKLGVVGMDERAQLLGSRLTIKSKPGSGTTVFIEAPV